MDLQAVNVPVHRPGHQEVVRFLVGDPTNYKDDTSNQRCDHHDDEIDKVIHGREFCLVCNMNGIST
jgi:hypothetical protein